MSFLVWHVSKQHSVSLLCCHWCWLILNLLKWTTWKGQCIMLGRDQRELVSSSLNSTDTITPDVLFQQTWQREDCCVVASG